MEIIDTFISSPNWIPHHIERQFERFYPLLNEFGFNPRTIGTNVVPLSSSFEDVVHLMNQCRCTIVLGLPHMRVSEGKVQDEEIKESFFLPTEWNQIEATISIMLNKPTLMMLHKGVASRGLFDRGAANVFVHDFHTLGRKWLRAMVPKLEELRDRVQA